MKRIVGLDLNGWTDVAARDWSIEEPDEVSDSIDIISGGVAGVAVQQREGGWVGGPQAILAPHGRGLGWGELGDAGRRISIADAWDSTVLGDGDYGEPIRAGVNALARGASEVILGVPDVVHFEEAAQGRVLSIVRHDRLACRLLWRPVAAFLYALENGKIATTSVGQLFRFIIHTGTGVEIQTLRLRQDGDHPSHFAPERDGYGVSALPQYGLKTLKAKCHKFVLDANPSLRESGCEDSQLALRLMCGASFAGDREILRHKNSNWFEVEAPMIRTAHLFSASDAAEPEEVLEHIGGVAASFLLTPLAPPYDAALASILEQHFGAVQRLDWNAVALGGLKAGRLVERGLPHYFDRLTPIGLAVMKGSEPEFQDLVASDATLPANREYVSPPYRDLKWLRGKDTIEFYVLKGDTEIRHWEVGLEVPPMQDMTVELRLKQTPGQSWAKLSLTSSEFEPLQRSPIMLDWSSLRPIAESAADVLARLKTPPPTTPTRIVEDAHIDFWMGNDRFFGIADALGMKRGERKPTPGGIASLLARSMRHPATRARYWPVGTDGALPEGIPAELMGTFCELLKECEAKLIAANPRRPLPDNHAVRCLTWIHTRCPESVQEKIVEALEADVARKSHAFLAPTQARRVLTQAAGRAVTGVDRIRRVLRILVTREPNTDTLNALAMILSRRKEAPSALTRDLLNRIVLIGSRELANLSDVRSFKTRFRNTLLTVAAVFRYREIERYALIAGHDPVAQALSDELEGLSNLLRRNKLKVTLYEERLATVANILDYLKGHGDPNILRRIENLEDEGDG